jgi:heme/copper-type cytochrome/quinol oxidase subunit 2
MELTHRPALERPLGPVLLLFLGSCVLFAGSLAALSWTYLPYDLLERYTPEERFLVWEGVVWLFALLFTFMGVSAILEVAGLRVREAGAELVHRLRSFHGGSVLENGPAIAPWWMLTCGSLLMVIGTAARYWMAP